MTRDLVPHHRLEPPDEVAVDVHATVQELVASGDCADAATVYFDAITTAARERKYTRVAYLAVVAAELQIAIDKSLDGFRSMILDRSPATDWVFTQAYRASSHLDCSRSSADCQYALGRLSLAAGRIEDEASIFYRGAGADYRELGLDTLADECVRMVDHLWYSVHSGPMPSDED